MNTLAELIAYAKANPGKVNYGSAGSGGITHGLAGELLKAEAGIDIVHAPTKAPRLPWQRPARRPGADGESSTCPWCCRTSAPGRLKVLAIASLSARPACPKAADRRPSADIRRCLPTTGTVWRAGRHTARRPQAHPFGCCRGARFAGTGSAVRQGERRTDAFVAGRVRCLPRPGSGEVGQGGSRDWFQGRMSAPFSRISCPISSRADRPSSGRPSSPDPCR